MSYFACEVKKSLFWPKSYFERFIAKDFSRAASVFHEMKDVTGAFPKTHDATEVEAGWYNWWLKHKLFCYNQKKEGNVDRQENTFTMVLPPPNITGDLHLGHALTSTIQDSLVRWHRAKGFSTLWIPGYDHAGIATQIVIEKKFQAQTGRTRKEVNKHEFLNIANKWKEKKIDSIRNQLQRLGSSLDWNRECFTMDESFSEAVNEAFVRLHDEGLITREKALVNWCCHLQTAISDIEVTNIDAAPNSTFVIPWFDVPIKVGKLIYVAYKVANSDNDEIVVATTRPETILGDSAIAVNPTDHRFSRFVGRYVIHPFDGRLLPVIADSVVDPTFGSGCVKITPAHDYQDFEIAKRHNLPLYSVINETGHISSTVERFNGVFRFEAREMIINELQQLGILRGHHGHEMTLPICSRSGDIVEPLLRYQWFLDCSDMSSELIKDIQLERFSINPQWGKTILLNWLAERRKWCISRQLWWGHKIPAYYITCSDKDDLTNINWVVARNIDEALFKASQKLGRPVLSSELQKDKDVLDTWFSSALFPFAVFGWPKQDNSIFQKCYPLSLMETGHDIIFFWVARMAMLGQKLIGQRPFSKVLLHALICDSHGRKMSKSLGNVIDPLTILEGARLSDLFRSYEILCSDGYITNEELKKSKEVLRQEYPDGISKCGADVLRFALLSQDVSSQYVNLDIKYIHKCKAFCNKIWQACKFYVIALEKTHMKAKKLEQVSKNLSLFDRWILSKLYKMIHDCDVHFTAYNLCMVTKALHTFWYFRFCDVYLEGIKPVLNDASTSDEAKEAIASTLFACIQTACIAMAPIMPFLAEELYHRLALYTKDQTNLERVSVSLESYPVPENWKHWHNPELNDLFSEMLDVAAELRRIKSNYGVTKMRPEAYIVCQNEKRALEFKKCHVYLEELSKCKIIRIDEGGPVKSGLIQRTINKQVSVKVHLEGIVNSEEVKTQLCLRKIKLQKELEDWIKKVENPKYNKIFTKDKQQAHRDRINILEDQIQLLELQINELQHISV